MLYQKIYFRTMNVVTLTTDFGRQDYYVAVIKGTILSKGMPVLFADITHEIDNYNIVQASFILKNAYQSFPAQSIHLISVHNFYQKKPRFVAIYHNNHYFIGPDNGIFSLLFDLPLDYICEISPSKDNNVLAVKNVFADTVAHILKYQSLEGLGHKSSFVLERHSLRPITGNNHIRGSVLHIDKFSNVILNISQEVFERIGKGRPFELYYKRYDPVTSISTNYAEVSAGEVLCLFNAAGLLEIAVNLDKAATLFGLDVDDAIQIDFEDSTLLDGINA